MAPHPSPSSICAPPQYMSHLPAGAALLEANAGLFLSLPPEPGPPPAQSLVDLAETTLSGGAAVAILAADMLAAVHPQQQAEQAMVQQAPQHQQAEQAQQQAQQHQQVQQTQQPAAGGLGEPALQLAAAVLQKHHWLMSEMVAATAG